jgi:hypothetical protein
MNRFQVNDVITNGSRYYLIRSISNGVYTLVRVTSANGKTSYTQNNSDEEDVFTMKDNVLGKNYNKVPSGGRRKTHKRSKKARKSRKARRRHHH